MNEFLVLYEEVFDENVRVTNCGRDKCRELIAAARKIDKQRDFGSIKTGFLNVSNMVALRNELLSK